MVTQENYPSVMETIIAATIMALLGLLGLYIAPLFFIINILLPLPLAYLIIKRDLLKGLVALVLATGILVLVFGQVKPAFLLVMQFGPLGIIIGLLLKNKVTVDTSMGVLFFWALVIAGVNLFFSFVVSGAGISQVTNEFRVTMEQMAHLYGQNGMMDEASKQQYLEVTEQLAHLVQIYLPGSVAVWNIAITLLTFFITRRLMRGLGFDVPGELQFTRWRLPWYSIWLIITGLALAMAGDEFSFKWAEIVGKNILYISAFLFFMLGNAVLMFFLQKWKLSRVAKIIIAVALILYLPFTLAVALTLGIVDPVANLRRLPSDDGPGTKGG